MTGATAAVAAEPLVLSEVADGIARLTLNNAARRNSLSEAMMAALKAALQAAAADADVRVVIIAAAGPVFSAGHDLKELTSRRGDGDRGRAYFDKIMRQCADLMQTIVHLTRPVIAEVQGTATAAGCQLVASCDLAVTVDSAHFCTPGVNIGLFCSTPMVALSRNLPRKRAMQMLLTGDMIDAGEAADWGLVNTVVPAAELRATTEALAAKIAAKSSLTVKTGKEAFYRQIDMGLADAYDYAASVMVENMLARDAEEGIGAFLEKRTPKWQGC
ncbi:MAG TPA: enoyl-CoA hydratase [Hyphomicrobiales bacterium]|nr:enoyl-CoA hydratase [Hyphomicrobiales bacterium]